MPGKQVHVCAYGRLDRVREVCKRMTGCWDAVVYVGCSGYIYFNLYNIGYIGVHRFNLLGARLYTVLDLLVAVV